MAIIGKIREKSSLLLILVGGALAAFILNDLFSSRSSVFGSDINNIGTIDGLDIKGIDFNAKYEAELENYKTREKTAEVPEFIQGQIRDQVWDQYLNEYILGKQLDELGMAVSTEELADMAYGDNPHSQVVQAFTNPETGQFNKNDVINFLKNMDQDETGKTKSQWLVFEKAMKDERRVNKYYTLIQKGLYTTTAEAKDYLRGQQRISTLSFIVKRYSDIADSTVKVEESDIKAYYKANSYKYKEKKSRKIEYALFNVLPSREDSAEAKEWVDEIWTQFKTTKDDSNFVNANSDNEFDYKFYSLNDKNAEIDTNFYKTDSIGYTTTPVIVNGSWKISKVTKSKMASDSVKARHILLSFTKKDKEIISARLDSIKAAIDGGVDFAGMAEKYSVDPGSSKKGGDLGWFKEGYMIPVINDSCFKADTNKLMIVESPFGLHLIEVTDKSPVVRKLQVAMIFRSLDASKETVDRQFTASNDFSLKMETEEMNKLAELFKVPYNSVDIRENDNMIPEIESSRGLIRWAYNAEVGQVSEALQFGNIFVIAKLLEVHEEGIAPLENVRDKAEMGAIKEKKAIKFMEEMAGFTDLNEAAGKLGLTIEKAEGVVFESYSAPGLGREPNVIGRIFTMEEGDLSIPIKGDNGVFIVQIDKVEDNSESQDVSPMKAQLSQNRSSRVNFEVFEALKERVEIVDNRFKIY